MIIACIIALFSLFAVLVIALFKTNNSNENDSEYYVDGYHIYYDRKIIRELNKNNH